MATVGVVILTMSACGGNATDTDAAASTPKATQSARTAPAKVAVPRVVGLSLRQATKQLENRGLGVGSIVKRPSAKPRRTVLAQSDRPRSKVRTGTDVSLVIAVPLPVVPDTIGTARSAAKRQIRRAGFNVRTIKKQTDSASPGTVIAQIPDGGERAKPGATVRITVAVKPPPSPVEEAGGDCTPGYSPCLPPASDYDCAGGSGNGPAYADGPIYVTGADPYGLDSDSDGVACES